MPLRVQALDVTQGFEVQAKIYAEAGKSIGLGHVSRCIALYDAFEERGVHCNLTLAADEYPSRLLGERRCTIVDWRRADFAGNIPRFAGVSVVDSYFAPPETYRLISDSCDVGVYIDDTCRIPYPRGIVLRNGPLASMCSCKAQTGVSYLIGPAYHLLRRAFWDVRPREEIPDEIERILLSLGMTAPADLLIETTRAILRLFRLRELYVVIGRKDEAIEASLRKIGGRIRTCCVLSSEDMRDLMLASDFAVSAGGQTLNELARCGLPSVSIQIADNQDDNIKGFAEYGTTLFAGRAKDKYVIRSLSHMLEKCRQPAVRASLSHAGPILIDGQGPRRVATQVLAGLK